MGKMTTYILITVGVILLFAYFGLTNNDDNGITFGSAIMQYALNPETGNDSNLWQFIVNTSADSQNFGLGAVMAAITIFTTAAGLFLKNDFMVLAPIVSLLVGLAMELISIYNYLFSIINIVAIFLMAPFLVGFFFAILEWWRGVTT